MGSAHNAQPWRLVRTAGDRVESVAVPVAVYRIGHPTAEVPRSNRRPLADCLRPSRPVATAG